MSRRATIAGAGLLAGCEHAWPPLPPAADNFNYRAVADTHCHFFNASDLPVAGFLKYCFVREKLPDLPDIGLALIDLLDLIVKPWSMTAARELELLQDRQGDQEQVREITPNEFGVGVIERRQRFILAESTGHQTLSEILARGYNESGARVIESMGFTEAARARADAQSFANIARYAYARNDDIRRRYEDAEVMNFSGTAVRATAVVDIINMVKWAYIVLQPRSCHLDRFVRLYRRDGVQPQLVANLLVDYDDWLKDCPSAGSSDRQQVEFWDACSRHYAGNIDVRTLFGFCPLKEAISRVTGEAATGPFAKLQEYYAATKVAGVKLYSPMGFQASGNAGLSFIGDDGIGNQVVELWREKNADHPGWTKSLGQSLDLVLNEMFQWCARWEVPILAHSGPSNLPAANFDDRPNPAHWWNVLHDYPNLRLSIGHFVHDAKIFTEAMEKRELDPKVWAFDGTQRLLRGYPNVFADIAYTDELLKPENQRCRLPVRFFSALKTYCKEGLHGVHPGADPRMERFLYGSDWIMLGLENGHPNYLSDIRIAMDAAGWTGDEIERVCETNAKRWLGDRRT